MKITFRIVEVGMPTRTETVTVSDKAIVIGRADGSSVSVSDAKCSRAHAAIAIRQGRIYLKDCGSRNGTYLNGAKVNSTPLKSGDQIKVGSTQIRVEFKSDKRVESTATLTSSMPKLPPEIANLYGNEYWIA